MADKNSKSKVILNCHFDYGKLVVAVKVGFDVKYQAVFRDEQSRRKCRSVIAKMQKFNPVKGRLVWFDVFPLSDEIKFCMSDDYLFSPVTLLASSNFVGCTFGSFIDMFRVYVCHDGTITRKG